ncbi:DUF6691 family protein [Nitrosomonas sp.]|uniref:DUF6691 family protein n=2 Tax=Nitrosomonas sp. TaxID=42353 RepID=UPI00351F87D8
MLAGFMAVCLIRHVSIYFLTRIGLNEGDSKVNFMALLSGIVFILGIILYGMINPAIVLTFLEIRVAGILQCDGLGGVVAIDSIAFSLVNYRKNKCLCLSV